MGSICDIEVCCRDELRWHDTSHMTISSGIKATLRGRNVGIVDERDL
jgi:hypothetical protein